MYTWHMDGSLQNDALKALREAVEYKLKTPYYTFKSVDRNTVVVTWDFGGCNG